MTDAPRAGDAEASAAALDGLYERSPCGYISTTVDGAIVRVNATFLRWTGYRAEEVLGRTFTSLLSIGSQLFFETRFLSVLHLQGEAREVALTLKTADGRSMPILVNAVAVPGEDGRPAIIRTAIFDSTGRQDYERELLEARRLAEASETHLRLLQDASSTFVRANTETSLADELARSSRVAFAATHVTVRLLDDDGRLVLRSGEDRFDRSDLPSSTPEEDALRTGTAVAYSRGDLDAERYVGLSEALRRVRIESLSIVPIMDEGTPLGVVSSYFGRARVIDAQQTELQLALARQAAQLFTRIRLQSRLEQLALHDQLTGLANRKRTREHFAVTFAETLAGRRQMALIFVDLDGFKAINDTFGHGAGDSVLREVGQRLASVVRETDLVGRWGGDEFVIVCEDAGRRDVERITERLRDEVHRPMASHPTLGSITTSIGVALVDGTDAASATAEQIFEAADAAMYTSKRGGKDRVTVVAV